MEYNGISKERVEDYIQIEQFVDKYYLDSLKFGHLRQFLALSYSKLQVEIDKSNMDNNWKWYRWFSKYFESLNCIVSFNYDLLLERTLSNLKIQFFRMGSNESKEGIPIIKPHGSIDYDIPPRAINIQSEYRLNCTTFLNDAQEVHVITNRDMQIARIEADIIPPTKHNYQSNLSWIKTPNLIYEKTFSLSVDTIIVVGLSYWDVDRPEIDYYLQCMHKSTKVIYTENPSFPNHDFKQKLKSLGLEYQAIDFNTVPDFL